MQQSAHAAACTAPRRRRVIGSGYSDRYPVIVAGRKTHGWVMDLASNASTMHSGYNSILTAVQGRCMPVRLHVFVRVCLSQCITSSCVLD